MFKNLYNLLNSKGITNDELSNVLGIHRNTLNSKMSGESQFNLEEIEKIMIIFKEYNFSYLFAREREKATA